MKLKRYIPFVLSLALVMAACDDVEPTIAKSKDPDTEKPGEEPDPGPDGTERVVVDFETTYQTIESFEASDAWYPNYVGKYWSEDLKTGIAKLLFSGEIVGGQPQGIGLSGWRFNLGAGSAQQSDANTWANDDSNFSRKAESFMDPATGAFLEDMQAGQRWFLQQALSYGMTERFTMFLNSPPAYLTRNNRTFRGSQMNANIAPENYQAFAEYIVDCIDFLRQDVGVTFDLVSPMNEPQYAWNGGQEGSPYTNEEAAALVRVLNDELATRGSTTKILIPEAGKFIYLYDYDTNAAAGDQIYEFYNPAKSNTYIGGLSHLYPAMAAHSYWWNREWGLAQQTRERAWERAQEMNLKLMQTEWSMLDFDNTDGKNMNGEENRAARYLERALYLSKVIHWDMVYSNVVTWSYWTSLDVDRWSHENRFLLIQLEPTDGPYATDALNGGAYYSDTKNLWVLGNYSRFIRPGYKRIKLDVLDETTDTNDKEFFGSAYASSDKKTIVAVYTNFTDDEEFDVRADLSFNKVSSIKTYTTSAEDNLKERTVEDKQTPIIVGPHSVVTVVYEMKQE